MRKQTRIVSLPDAGFSNGNGSSDTGYICRSSPWYWHIPKYRVIEKDGRDL